MNLKIKTMMPKNTIFYILIVTISIVCITCSKYMEETPNDFYDPSTFFETEEDVILASNAMYQDLMTYELWIQPAWRYPAIDNPDLFNNEWVSSNNYRGNFGMVYAICWQGFYKVIGNVNNIFDNIPNVDVSEDVKNQVLGEAYFLRAYCYYELVKRYGPCVIRTHSYNPQLDGFGHANRQPVDVVYKQIASDLRQAVDYLQVATANMGRPSKQSAMGLLSKIYLHMAGTEVGIAEYNDSAAIMALALKDMAESVGYPALEDEYMDNFIIETQMNSPEILFSIQTADEPGENGSEMAGYFTPLVGGYKLSGQPSDGDYISLRKDFYETFEPGDERVELGTAVFNMWINQDLDTVYFNKAMPAGYLYYLTDTVGLEDIADTLDYIDDCENSRTYLTYIKVSTVTGDTASEVKVTTRPYCMKYFDTEANTKFQNRNQPVILRYADVLLVLAEAENEVNGGPTALAYEALNTVRDRAELTPLSGLSYEEFRDAVWLERRHELYAEWHSKFDLVRQGRWLDMMNSLCRPRQEFQILQPISQQEINTNDSIFVNNPGY